MEIEVDREELSPHLFYKMATIVQEEVEPQFNSIKIERIEDSRLLLYVNWRPDVRPQSRRIGSSYFKYDGKNGSF